MNTKSISNSSFTFRTFALVSAMAVLGVSPTLADEASRSMKVSYSDLDLSTQAGAATLYNRIRGAARQVCGYEGVTYTDHSSWKRCFNGAVGNAVTKVNSPRLTALHEGKSPTVTAMLGK
jgi:UrcA family protein